MLSDEIVGFYYDGDIAHPITKFDEEMLDFFLDMVYSPQHNLTKVFCECMTRDLEAREKKFKESKGLPC